MIMMLSCKYVVWSGVTVLERWLFVNTAAVVEFNEILKGNQCKHALFFFLRTRFSHSIMQLFEIEKFNLFFIT